MKKIIFVLLILICCFFGIKTWFTKETKVKEEKMMEGWYVEISNSYINVREEPNTYSSLLGKVNEGEKYEVLDINLDNGKYYWYYIEFGKNKKGWIASSRTSPYLADYNNPTDIAVPTLKLFDNVYYVDSIDEINYDHLEITDDKDDFKVTHVVYKERTEFGDYQYWINYTVTDGAGKTASKMQKIIFLNEPKNNEVLNFDDYKN